MEASESSAEPAAPWAVPETPEAVAVEDATDTFAERPEVFVGAAFAGGLSVALLLKWLDSR